ncbi:hypothetical protein BDW74DRAFT_187847 [Aspergillus multicolor]|uniref:uncharacterized protein n=1 Tax=Aspergillus multicolor TaxID=41759 RepID=UPI003CCCB757
MATSETVPPIERILNYTFKSKGLLLEALTAAGANEDNHEGNRRFSHVGLGIIHTVLSLECLERKSSPERKKELCAYTHLAAIGERCTIDRYINYSPRSGRGSKTVIGTTVAAILGAVFLDSDCRKRTWEVMQHVGFFLQAGGGVNPAELQSGPRVEMEQGAAARCSENRTAIPEESIGEGFDNSNAVVANSEHPLPARSFHGLINTVQIGTTSHDGPSPPRSASRKKRKRTFDEIEDFVSYERKKCMAANTSLPEESYFAPEIQKRLNNLPKLATKLILGIGSAQSLVNLRQAIQRWRSEEDTALLKSRLSLTKVARFTIIRNIDGETAYLSILKRYHILELFKQCGGHETPSCSGFVLVPGEPTTNKKIGNPHNNAEAEVTACILRDMYPNLKPTCAEYRPTLESLKQYRQLGRRFWAITLQYGQGVLALLPSGDPPADQGIFMANKIICNMKEQAFLQTLSILEASQGEVIRTMSRAAEKHIEALFSQAPYECLPFKLEEVQTGDILQLPKNSPGLLSILE